MVASPGCPTDGASFTSGPVGNSSCRALSGRLVRLRYPHAFGSFATDWDEIDTVVAFIRSLRGDRALKVNLVGWSRGGMRVIGYAALRPDNIEKVVALAPTRFPPVASVPNYPMNITDKRDFFVDWDRQIDSENCPQQVDPSIRR